MHSSQREIVRLTILPVWIGTALLAQQPLVTPKAGTPNPVAVTYFSDYKNPPAPTPLQDFTPPDPILINLVGAAGTAFQVIPSATQQNWLQYAVIAANGDCSSARWISGFAFNAQMPAALCVTASQQNILPHGFYPGQLTIATGRALPAVIRVVLNSFPTGYLSLYKVTGSTPQLFDQGTLTFTPGNAGSSQTIQAVVSDPNNANTTVGTPQITVQPTTPDGGQGATWVVYSASTDASSKATKSVTDLKFTINPNLAPSGADLSATVTVISGGTYQGTDYVYIDGSAFANAPAPATPTLVVTPGSASFSCQVGGVTQDVAISISASDNSSIPVQYSLNGIPGLTGSLTSGNTPATLTLHENCAAVTPGFQGTVTISSGTQSVVNLSVAVSVTPGANVSSLYFVPVTPCHMIDTRAGQGTTGAFGPPSLPAGSTRTFTLSAGGCAGISASAKAFSLTLTAFAPQPPGYLGYLTIWPADQSQPGVSTFNGPPGYSSISNAAIVPVSADGKVNIFVTDTVDLAVDVNGYFDSVSSAGAYAFYPLAPCRISNTRLSRADAST